MSELVDSFREHLLEGAEDGSLSVIVENYKQLRDSIISIRESHTVANGLLPDSADAEKLNQGKAQAQLTALEEAYYQITSEIEHEITVPPEPLRPMVKGKFDSVLVHTLAGAILGVVGGLVLNFLRYLLHLIFSTNQPGLFSMCMVFLVCIMTSACFGYYSTIESNQKEANKSLAEYSYKYAEWVRLKAEAERQERTIETKRKLRATLSA